VLFISVTLIASLRELSFIFKIFSLFIYLRERTFYDVVKHGESYTSFDLLGTHMSIEFREKEEEKQVSKFKE
jgi:hypothetical protein